MDEKTTTTKERAGCSYVFCLYGVLVPQMAQYTNPPTPMCNLKSTSLHPGHKRLVVPTTQVDPQRRVPAVLQGSWWRVKVRFWDIDGV